MSEPPNLHTDCCYRCKDHDRCLLNKQAAETLAKENAERIGELEAELRRVEDQRDYICRKANVVQFQDGEVKNFRAEKSESERDAALEKLAKCHDIFKRFTAAYDAADEARIISDHGEHIYGRECPGCQLDMLSEEIREQIAATAPAKEGE